MENQRSVEEIIADLEVFDTQGDYIPYLVDLMEESERVEQKEGLLKALFGVLERFPDEELGMPSPIVHVIKHCAGYEEELLKSLKRQPGILTVWMMYKLFLEKRDPNYLAALKEVLDHPKASEQTKEDASIVINILI